MPKPTKAEVLATIKRARGSLKGKMGEEPFAVWWARHKREELELEERRYRQFYKVWDNQTGR